MRVYLDRTVPKAVVAQLEALGAQLKWMDDASMSGGIGGMFWRFLVAADRDVDRFIIRDSDSRLNPRERCAIATECLSDCLSECLTKCHEPRSTVRRLAVEEWIASGKRMH